MNASCSLLTIGIKLSMATYCDDGDGEKGDGDGDSDGDCDCDCDDSVTKKTTTKIDYGGSTLSITIHKRKAFFFSLLFFFAFFVSFAAAAASVVDVTLFNS